VNTYVVCDIYGKTTFIDAETFIFEDTGIIEFKPKPSAGNWDNFSTESVERICKKVILPNRDVRFREVWPLQGELEDWG
jgi:hypothetical protein